MVSKWIEGFAHFFYVGMVIVAAVLAAWLGPGPALLFAAGSLLVIAVLCFHASLSVPRATDALSLEDALELASPMASEQHKMVVLRGLKDLKYEYQVGKVSEEDYQVLTQRYRVEAMTLLGEMDQSELSLRNRIEELVRERMQAETTSAAASSAHTTDGSDADRQDGVS